MLSSHFAFARLCIEEVEVEVEQSTSNAKPVKRRRTQLGEIPRRSARVSLGTASKLPYPGPGLQRIDWLGRHSPTSAVAAAKQSRRRQGEVPGARGIGHQHSVERESERRGQGRVVL